MLRLAGCKRTRLLGLKKPLGGSSTIILVKVNIIARINSLGVTLTFFSLGARQPLVGLKRIEYEIYEKQFDSQGTINKQMTATKRPKPNIPCQMCGRKFRSREAAEAHMKALGHFINYCKKCEKQLPNTNEYQMVRLSYANNPLLTN